MMNKIELRKEIRKRKKKFSNEELSLMSVPIIDRLWKNIKFISSNTILLYYSLPDEVNTHDLVKKLVSLGKKSSFTSSYK